MASDPAQPLEGLRVLDLTVGMAGSIATMVLADYGAEVIRVERPGGGFDRAARTNRTWDRGKRSIVLDLTDDADRVVAVELAAAADVVVGGLRPGVLDRFGLGYDDVAAANPAVVYCSLSGYGLRGVDRDRSGLDALVAARLGLMAEWGGSREGPIFLGHPAVGYSTGLLACVGILAALRARLVDGAGDHLDVSLRDGALAQMPMNWWSERKVSFVAGKSRTGQLDLGHRRLLLRRYVCGDGRMIQVHTGAAGAFGRAMAVFGLSDTISPPADPSAETASELTDADLEILATRLPELLGSRPAQAWLEALWAANVAALPVQPPGAVFDDDQIRSAGLVKPLADADLGEIEVVGPAVGLPRLPAGALRPVPVLDGDGPAIRADGWRSVGLRAEGAPARPAPSAELPHPLSGVRVVELSTWFASAYANRLLSDLGADVVKVEAPSGDPMRPLPDPFEGSERGKRDLAMDLKGPGADEVVRRLFEGATVVQHNLRPGTAERIGVGFATAEAANASLVYTYSPGYGSQGPKAGLQSFAPLLSGFVGIFHEAAGPGNDPHASFGNEDYYNGLLSACASLLGLIRRERTGQGGFVECPQVHSAVLATSAWYLHGGEAHTVNGPLDTDQTCFGPGWGIYQCLVGWLAVACAGPAQLAALAATVLPEGEVPTGEQLAERLRWHLVEDTAEGWAARLAGAGVPCEVVREDSWLAELFHDPELVEAGVVAEDEHPIHGRVRTIARLVRPARRAVPRRGRSPLLGEHSVEILEELGFGADEISTLRDAGTVVAGRAAVGA